MQMKTIIIDDELLNIKNIVFYMDSYFPWIQIVGTFTNIHAASELILKQHVDLVFLDIQMPTGNGFDLLDLFPERAFDVIFITAFEEFALKAIKAGAVDYVLKPIVLDDLTVAMERIHKKYLAQQQVNAIMEPKSEKILLQNSDTKRFVCKEDIIYIQGIDNICKIFFENNTKMILSKTLKYFETLLGQDFYRIHKSFLVNLTSCNSIQTTEKYQVVLKNNVKLPVSRRSVKELKNRLIGM
ncbi:hypothetical protein B0A77_04505 [Flavobacterium branchiophilum]|uniref:LytTR family two component transcriptional regulator n=2 Tax=Flavobacterium branchiophilum TaxID=55197 RepID=A0A2H3KZY0_9FLAO|nr:hypothetical protein B0A77_04505 [Flavobacterium branchiophilum]